MYNTTITWAKGFVLDGISKSGQGRKESSIIVDQEQMISVDNKQTDIL